MTWKMSGAKKLCIWPILSGPLSSKWNYLQVTVLFRLMYRLQNFGLLKQHWHKSDHFEWPFFSPFFSMEFTRLQRLHPQVPFQRFRLCAWALPVPSLTHGTFGAGPSPATGGALLQRPAYHGQWHFRVGGTGLEGWRGGETAGVFSNEKKRGLYWVENGGFGWICWGVYILRSYENRDYFINHEST